MRGEVLGLLDVFNDVLIQPFLPDGAVVALYIGVLNRSSFAGDQLVRVTRPYRVCLGLHRRPPQPQLVVCFRWVQAGGGY